MAPMQGDDFAGKFGELFGCGEGTERVRRALQIISTVFSSAVEGIVVTDPTGIIRMVNPAFSSITGYCPEEAVGRNPRILKSDRHPPEFYENFWKTLINEGKWEGEIWNRRKSGEVYPEWLCCSAVHDENGAVTDYIAVFNDLSEVHFKDAQIELRSNFDQLTGLASRAVFYSRLEGELERQDRDGRRLALLVLDINRKQAVLDDEPLALTAYEYRILEYLMRHHQQVVAKDRLMEQLYPDDEERDPNVIEVLVGRLRRKLEGANGFKPIDTVRGLGYLFTERCR